MNDGNDNGNGRNVTIRRETAITLGLAFAMCIGAVAIVTWVMQNVPTSNDIKVIVRDETKAIVDQQKENTRIITQIEGRIEAMQVQLNELKEKVRGP